MRSASGAVAHKDILNNLAELHSNLPDARPIAQPAVQRDRKREIQRGHAAKLIQSEWRRIRHRKILQSENFDSSREVMQRDALMREIVGGSGVVGSTNEAPFLLPQQNLGNARSQSFKSSMSPRGEYSSSFWRFLSEHVLRRQGSTTSEEGALKRSSASSDPGRKGFAGPVSSTPLDYVAVDMEGSSPVNARSKSRREIKPPPPPSTSIARAYAESRLARQQMSDDNPGELYPLYTPIETFDRFGTDLSQYIHFNYYTARLFLALFLLNLSNLITNWEGGYLSELGLDSAAGVNPVAVWHTLGNAPRTGVLGGNGYSYVIVEFLTSAILVIYLFWIRSRMATVRRRIRNSVSLNTLTAADFTVLVKNFPPRWDSSCIRQFFERYAEVVHVGFSLNNRELVLKMNHAQQLREKHTEASLRLLSLMSKMARKEEVLDARKKAFRWLERLEKNKRSVNQLLRKRYHTTGHAFVTFNKSLVAQKVANGIGISSDVDRTQLSDDLRSFGMHVQRAPEPSDVLWENLIYDSATQYLRQAISSFILILLMGVGITVIFISNFYLQPGVNPSVEAEGTGSTLGLFLAALIVNVAGHLVFFLSIVALTMSIERQHTRGERELVMMIKMTIFQVLAVVVQAILFLYFDVAASQIIPVSQGQFVPDWYVSGGQVVLSALLGDVLVIGLGIDFFRPIPDLMRRYILGRNAQTQAKKNEFWSASGELVIGYRIQLMNKIVWVGLMFSFAIPILYLIIFLYLWSAHWVDRYVFLRRVRPPPITATQMEIVISFIFPSAVLMHTVMALIFFNDLCAGSEAHFGESLSCVDAIDSAPKCASLKNYTEGTDQSIQRAVYGKFPRSTPQSWRWGVAQGVAAENWTVTQVESAQTLTVNCIIPNKTVFPNESPVCFSPPRGCTTDWGGAHYVLLASAVLWGSITVFYLLRSYLSYQRKHVRGQNSESLSNPATPQMTRGSSFDSRNRWRSRRYACGSGSFFLNMWRFFAQHDVERMVDVVPPDARIWDDERRRARSGGINAHQTQFDSLAHAPPENSEDDIEDAVSDPMSLSIENWMSTKYVSDRLLRVRKPLLHPETEMYLPPLTLSLLTIDSNSRLDRKLIQSYLQMVDGSLQHGDTTRTRPASFDAERARIGGSARRAFGSISMPNSIDLKQVHAYMAKRMDELEAQIQMLDDNALGLGAKYRRARSSLRGASIHNMGRRSPMTASVTGTSPPSQLPSDDDPELVQVLSGSMSGSSPAGLHSGMLESVPEVSSERLSSTSN